MGYVMYGKVFGNLTIISANHMIKIEGNARKRNKYWLCRCKCGVEKYVSGRRLVAGKTKSCGCLKGHAPRTKNPNAVINRAELKETLASYHNMLTRCYNEKSDRYKNYGGRGITVCERWRSSFEDFLADMGMRPQGTTIGREDNNGNYELGNVRWETDMQQRYNKSTTAVVTH